jgi:hypothetical protein
MTEFTTNNPDSHSTNCCTHTFLSMERDTRMLYYKINNLMKLGSLGNVPQKLKKLVIKTCYISDCYSIFKRTI